MVSDVKHPAHLPTKMLEWKIMIQPLTQNQGQEIKFNGLTRAHAEDVM